MGRIDSERGMDEARQRRLFVVIVTGCFICRFGLLNKDKISGTSSIWMMMALLLSLLLWL
jgi:hypothetical protein